MKKSGKLPLIISLVATVLGIALVVGIAFFVITYFRESSSRADSYAAAVQMMETTDKAFAVGETAHIGPYDIQIVSTQENYVPSEAEASTARKALARYERPVNSDTEHYVLVKMKVTYNPSRTDYDRLSTSTGGWLDQIDKITLNDNRALVVSPEAKEQTPREREAAAKTDEGLEKTLIYRTAKETSSLTLGYKITIFTKVSSFVGTEGMPSKTYEYTISIQ